MLRILFLLLLLILTEIPVIAAGEVSLAWDPPEIATDVTGYMIHYGIESRGYTGAVDVGLSLTGTVPGLSKGIYYFAATAYNVALYESEYSNEVSIPVVEPNFRLVSK